MARVFISGSSIGLGLMAGQLLVEQGHQVVLHARNGKRANDARRALPRTEEVVTGDLETIAGAKDVAAQVNGLGRFDAVIHNAAVGYREPHHLTADGLPHVFSINTLAAYILTALIERPKRLVYLSSGMHQHADANLDDILWRKRRWNGSTAYAESKLHDAMLAFAVARRWPDVLSNAVEPGWVAFGGDHTHRLPPREECSLAEFDAAMQTLTQSVPAIKRRIVVACAACILANQQVTVREAELLRAICDTLDCPLPPLVVEGGR